MEPLAITKLVAELTSPLLSSVSALQDLRIGLVEDEVRSSCKGVVEETASLVSLLMAEQASQRIEQSLESRLESLQEALEHFNDVFVALDKKASVSYGSASTRQSE